MSDVRNEGIELPEELLELVNGGAINNSYRRRVQEFAEDLADNGFSLEEALSSLAFLANTENGADMLSIIKGAFTHNVL